jgi:hypothetical protein
LLLGGLVALTTGFVLAGVSAGRRTAAAFPQFVAAHGYDAVAYGSKPLPQIAHLHEVRSVTALRAPATAVPSCACSHTISQEEFNLYVAPTKTLSQSVNLVAGRMPDPSDPHEILASFNLQDDGVHVGIPKWNVGSYGEGPESRASVHEGNCQLIDLVNLRAPSFPGAK